jgi:hypothetical protein
MCGFFHLEKLLTKTRITKESGKVKLEEKSELACWNE